ncbi:MAG TPA: hypothetical protein VN132_05860 [Bdellovibrio sp.]|nr:hypothetical protein [Bdellovibrio sp.]
MKQTILSKTLLAALVSASLLMTACAKKDDSSGVRIANRGGAVASGGTSTLPNNSATCSNGQTGTGSLSTDTNSILALVSATIAPTSFGNICKVNFSASLKYDASGNIIPGGSAILIQIVDDWVGQVYNGKTLQPYEIQFTQAVSGNYDRGSGSFQAVFQDSYGSFTMSGQVSGATASGTVSFQNTVAVAGYSPVGGQLGNFSISTAVLMK